MRISLSKKIICLALLTLSSCNYYKNRGDQSLPNFDANTDVTALAVYNNYASINNLIISNQCLNCHSNATGNKGGLNIETYSNVKANLNQIMYRVLETKDMPPNGMSESQTNLFKFWLESGAPEFNTIVGPGTVIQGPLNWLKIKNQILAKNCLDCHSGEKADAGIDLSNLDIFKSNYAKIFDRVFVKQDMPMEPYGSLTIYERQALMKWMSQGFPQ